jgi:hypothetical protein
MSRAREFSLSTPTTLRAGAVKNHSKNRSQASIRCAGVAVKRFEFDKYSIYTFSVAVTLQGRMDELQDSCQQSQEMKRRLR